VTEALLQSLNELLADLGVLVKLLKVVALLGAGVTADGANVDHAVAELDKGTALDGEVEVGDVVEAEVGELLVLVLADPLDEGVGLEGLAELVGSEAVLGEAKVEEGGDGLASGLAQLLLLLGKVGAADVADGALGAEVLEDLENLGGGVLLRLLATKEGGGGTSRMYQAGGGEGAVDVEEADGVLERTLREGSVGRRRVGHCEICEGD
jgi:hypothetical protein